MSRLPLSLSSFSVCRWIFSFDCTTSLRSWSGHVDDCLGVGLLLSRELLHARLQGHHLRFQGVPALLQLHALDVAAALVLEQLLGLPLDLLLRLYDFLEVLV